jgi:IS605 OrfB family transposase
MIVTQTVRIKLAIKPDQALCLDHTARQYARAFNAVAEDGWKARLTNRVELHKRTYRKLREELDLPSQLVISARMKAVEALRSTKALARAGHKVLCPSSDNPNIRFDARSFRLDWNEGVVKLTAIGGRISVPFFLDRYSIRFKGLKTCAAEVLKKRRGWFLHVVVEREVKEYEGTDKIVGVDRGIRRPAVTSDGEFLGEPGWRAVEERLVALRTRLQAKGSRPAKRHLDRLEDRLARFRRDCDHVLSKRLVQSCKPGDTLVFEDLTNIRGRAKARGMANRRRLHSWSFARLGALVSYKAALRGVRLAHIDPRDTSRRCPACGSIAKGNRRDQSHFVCLRCTYSRNADLIASWNVRDRYRGLWSPVSEAPGRVNGPNVGTSHHAVPASHAL